MKAKKQAKTDHLRGAKLDMLMPPWSEGPKVEQIVDNAMTKKKIKNTTKNWETRKLGANEKYAVRSSPENEAKVNEILNLEGRWSTYPQLKEAGLYVMKNGEGFIVVRVQRIEDGVRTFYNVLGANAPINVHADVMSLSVYQKIKE